MAKKTFIAGADLTGKVGYAVKADNGKVKLADTKGETCLGIVMNDNVADRGVGVALVGEVCKAKLASDVAMGALLAAQADGRLATTADSEADVAMALEAGKTGDLIYVVALV